MYRYLLILVVLVGCNRHPDPGPQPGPQPIPPAPAPGPRPDILVDADSIFYQGYASGIISSDLRVDIVAPAVNPSPEIPKPLVPSKPAPGSTLLDDFVQQIKKAQAVERKPGAIVIEVPKITGFPPAPEPVKDIPAPAADAVVPDVCAPVTTMSPPVIEVVPNPFQAPVAAKPAE